MSANDRKRRRTPGVAAIALAAALCAPTISFAKPPKNQPVPNVSLEQTLTPSPMFDCAAGTIAIRGTTTDAAATTAHVRVTDGRGISYLAQTPVKSGAFSCKYPADFTNAPPLSAQTMFLDATTDATFNVAAPGHYQAEATLLIYDSRSHQLPDLPSAFTNDLLDAKGRTDAQSTEFPTIRGLVNLYFHSEGAHFVGWDKPKFDLANPADQTIYHRQLALYDFAHRDRDWSTPLGHRVARTMWTAVWPTWFGPSNDNPIDGNPKNTDHDNYQPYTFTNDHADLLLIYLNRTHGVAGVLDDNLDQIVTDGVNNLIAIQHRDPSNFAAGETPQNTYTDGAYHYGMFVDGTWMHLGNGWFVKPDKVDEAHGGVFNGRATWALGEALAANPTGPQATKIKDAIRACAQFCYVDSVPLNYAHRTKAGHVYWRDAGEHGYFLAGLLAACTVAPDMPMPNPNGAGSIPLHAFCSQCLDALVDLKRKTNQWEIYSDVDAVALAALARGIRILPTDPHAAAWKQCAVDVADAWMAAKPDPAAYPGPLVMFGHRLMDGTTTFSFPPGRGEPNVIAFFVTGHWIRAMAQMHAITGEPKYADRATLMIRYLCGVNPWGARMLTETGGIYNAVHDSNGDGLEDRLADDLYPESTSFCSLGIDDSMRQLAGQTGK